MREEEAGLQEVTGNQNPGGLSPATRKAASRAMPAAPRRPSSKGGAISVTPCGTRRGGENFGRGMRGIGRPVTPRLGDLDEAGAQGERGVAGEVGDGEHLVAQGGDKQEVDLRVKMRAIASATLRRKRSA